jgi:ABC-2 type transport system permease protein
MTRTISNKKQKLASNLNLIWILSLKNLKVRYKNSILGFMWSLITPLMYLAIFTFVFSRAFPDVDNYPLFALTGLIFWNFFNHASRTAIDSVIAGKGIIKSINIQTITLPISEVITSLINLLFSFIPFAVLMYFMDASIGPETLLIFVVVALFALFTLGVGLFLCAFNVYFRDVGFLYTSLTSALFYFTPIAYSNKLVPESFLFIIKLNPLYHFIESFRSILYYNEVPTLQNWLLIIGITIGTLSIGTITYKKLERGFISNF